MRYNYTKLKLKDKNKYRKFFSDIWYINTAHMYLDSQEDNLGVFKYLNDDKEYLNKFNEHFKNTKYPIYILENRIYVEFGDWIDDYNKDYFYVVMLEEHDNRNGVSTHSIEMDNNLKSAISKILDNDNRAVGKIILNDEVDMKRDSSLTCITLIL